jgi:NAD(P)H-hydrate epimerase
MIPILSRAQMRAFDAHAVEVAKVPSVVLMENAGRGAAEVIVREIFGGRAEGRHVVIVCGTGNNGGDGFVVARHLLNKGARVDAVLCGETSKMTPECRTNHDAFIGVGGLVDTLANVEAFEEVDLVVDALFGTGLDRAVASDGPMGAVIRSINAANAAVVALDVPSGMSSDTGSAMDGEVVEADATITFAHLKLGHVTGRGARRSGKVHVVDIGVPASLRTEHSAGLVEASDVVREIDPRAVDVHKYRAGHVAVLAGSAGKTGAALLAARGALRAGAGAATIATWPDAIASIEPRVVEIMTTAIESTAQLEGVLANMRAVIVGPGFGTVDRARQVVDHVLTMFPVPIVCDADALSLLAGAIEDFAAAGGRAILTPHAGELARLLGTTSEAIENDRFAAARSAAARANAVVLLKGPYTVVAAPDARIVVSGSGSAALATAGSGDVLAGVVAALACSLPPFTAAWCGAFLHGVAGAAWEKEHGDRGLLASEIADQLPGVLAALR